MIGRDRTTRRWRIGELARATGVTVRTLYHYDEIGLLAASERTPAGHRRYTESDLRRLYRVRALRRLGLSLEEIGEALRDSPDDLATLRDLLTAQLAELDRDAGRIARLTARIGELLTQIDNAAMPGPQQFMTTLEMISMFDAYFTTPQRDYLATRRAALGEQAVDASRSRWVELVEQIRHHQQAGTPVDDPAVQQLVGQWDELAALFHGGDEQIKAAANRMWEDNRVELSRRMGWAPDQAGDLVAYLRRARQTPAQGTT